jgi:flagellin-like protein
VSNITPHPVRPLAEDALGERRGRKLQKNRKQGGKRKEMSAKTKRIERSQRFRRLRRGENRQRAVSPVVATLILILIAVAAAAALYLWLVAWQGNITGGIGQPGAQYTVTIGGSTSVYPFSSLAATWFEANNSDVVVSDNQGGTGAGMLAVCGGNVNVGAASTPETVTGLETPIAQGGDGCPTAPGLTITTIAYDAVDVAVPTANTHGLLGISWDTLTAIYDGASTSTPTLVSPSIDGQAVATVAPINAAPWSTHAALTWNEVPACVLSSPTVPSSFCGYQVVGGVTQAGVQEAIATSIGPGVACNAADTLLVNDICATGAGASPCGFAVCAGGSNAAIVPVERSDASGTTQTFEAKLLGATSSSGFAGSFSGLGYSGCGSNNLLSDCGISVTTQENGNPGVISAVAANPNAIGYASDGLIRATGSGVSAVAFLAVGQTINTGSSTGVFDGAVAPSTGATGTIAAGILDSSTVNQYSGWRPFEFVTLQPPTGEVQRYFEFILDPANNANLATATGEVSLYSI